MGRIIPYIVDNKKYLKPPTRILYTVQGQGSPQLSSPSLFFHVHLPVRSDAKPRSRLVLEQPIILEDNRCISAVFGPYKLNTIRLYPAPFLEHSGTTKKTTTNRKDVWTILEWHHRLPEIKNLSKAW